MSKLSEEFFHRHGYCTVKFFPSAEGANLPGVWAGTVRMLFTGNICSGLDETGWEQTWFYETMEEAIAALSCWDGVGDPPGLWIKQKRLYSVAEGATRTEGPSERLGPGYRDRSSVFRSPKLKKAIYGRRRGD